jgi:hypothetical protein
VKHELKQLRADQDHAAPHTLKDDMATVDNSADASGSSPKKLSRRRSRKLSHSAPKAPPVEDTSGSGLKKLDGARPKKSRHALNGDRTEDEGRDSVDYVKPDEHSKSGEHSKSKGHSKDKERKERGREKHRDKDHGEGKHKDKDDDQPLNSELAADPNTTQPSTSDPKASGEKPHKSGKSRKKAHASMQEPSGPERSASAPPGIETETQELKISTDSLSPSKAESNAKSPDPMSPPALGSAAKNASSPPPTTGPRRGIVEAFSKPGPAMRVLRRAMGRKTTPPNTSHDLGSASTVVNMTPAPASSPAGSSGSAPAATSPSPASATSPVSDPPFVMTAMPVLTQAAPGPSVDPLQVPRTVAFTPYPLPNVENIAGFGIPGVVHEMSHGQPFGSYTMPPHADQSRRFQDSTVRARGQNTPDLDPRMQNHLPRPPRASEERSSDGYERDFAWPYDPAWDQNRGTRGKGRDREDRHDRKHRSGHNRRHLSNEWHGEEGVTPVRRYVAAEDVPHLSSSRHVFDNIGYGESPPAYPLYEHGMLDSGMPRKSSFVNLRSMK